MKYTNGRITRWYLAMQPFRFKIKHVPESACSTLINTPSAAVPVIRLFICNTTQTETRRQGEAGYTKRNCRDCSLTSAS
ncbi:hypothetical protein QQF64_026305 [Cirrhinus molitorella]|uniref:Uncharacterized protein n=1 Tax=Cirrhinus molitorella TaxID=172907 RepID=A0ABR3NRG3_9TELE